MQGVKRGYYPRYRSSKRSRLSQNTQLTTKGRSTVAFKPPVNPPTVDINGQHQVYITRSFTVQAASGLTQVTEANLGLVTPQIYTIVKIYAYGLTGCRSLSISLNQPQTSSDTNSTNIDYGTESHPPRVGIYVPPINRAPVTTSGTGLIASLNSTLSSGFTTSDLVVYCLFAANA